MIAHDTEELIGLIQRELNEQGKTKMGLSEAVGFTPGAITRWLKLERKMPLEVMVSALDYLGCEIHIERKETE